MVGAGGGLIFKGTGFYITDYRSSDYQAKASADKPGGAPAPTVPANATLPMMPSPSPTWTTSCPA